MDKEPKSTSIFDASPEVIQEYLDSTGQTEKEARAALDEITERIHNAPGTVEGTDPTQKDKFTMPTIFIV